MGAANAAAGVTQAFSVGASGSRTAVNDDMGARSQIAGLVAALTPTAWLVFDAVAVTHIDSTGLEALDALAQDLRRGGTRLVVARLRTHLREQLEAGGVVVTIGPGRFYPSVEGAVDACRSDGAAPTGQPQT